MNLLTISEYNDLMYDVYCHGEF